MATATNTVVWHDLECGFYAADLTLWRELAELASEHGVPARILDVGSGTGRVTLDLAAAGHEVTALDLDAELLGALNARAADADLAVETVRADARTFDLGDDFALCVVPMQTIQLLGGAAGRTAFLKRARAHLRPGALVACAIVTELDPFDCAHGDIGPSPEVARLNGLEYISRATSVQVRRRVIRIERERRVLHIYKSARVATTVRALDAPEPERDVIELDRVSVLRLQREARSAGLSAMGVREIPSTDEHVGSDVVILRA
jgi:SAM-dependent methyltransferase